MAFNEIPACFPDLQAEITSSLKVSNVFMEQQPGVVLHHAGQLISLTRASSIKGRVN